MDTPAPCDIAIVGGGASGVLLAMHLLRGADAPLRIALVEPGEPAHGVAYATPYAEHLLNVPAARMSAFDDAPGDFCDFLSPGDTGAADGVYAQRRQYAAYLRDRLAQAAADTRASLEVVADRATRCDTGVAGTLGLSLASGGVLAARRVVLATGNAARPLPAPGAADLPDGVVVPAWDYAAIHRIDREADVTVIGCGLSMVDVALTLHARGHRGALHAVSRHALLPLPHLPAYRVADYPVARLLALPLRARLRTLRADARALAAGGVPWQDLLNALRPHVRALWQSLDAGDQRRFLRHAARHWDVHRHRIAPQAHAVLQALRADGRLRLHRGRIAALSGDGDGVRVSLAGRGGVHAQWRSDRIVNASGVELRASRLRQPLLDRLLDAGQARAGPHGLGIDTDADGRVLARDGQPHAALSALGSLRIGGLLESIAVPDLRGDAARLARRLCVELRTP